MVGMVPTFSSIVEDIVTIFILSSCPRNSNIVYKKYHQCISFRLLNAFHSDYLINTILFKINHPVHNICMYWPNFDCPQFVNNKSLYRNIQLTPSHFFWLFLSPNRSIIWGAVSLWTLARIWNLQKRRFVHVQ